MDIDALKRQLSCSSVIAQFVELQPSGRNLVGLCPFHSDKDTLSLTIYPDTGWCCFGCGRGGDVLNFLTEWGMSFQGALDWCESRIGKLPEPKFEPKFKKRKKVYFPSHHVIIYWHNLLRDRRKYFHNRMLSDETIDQFKLGWTGQRYSIPFWKGEPGLSKVIAVQSRRDGQNGPKYRWELGTQPNIFGLQNLLYYERTFVFFSTLDAMLAQQDGINTISIPGQTSGTSDNCWQALSTKAVSQIGFRDLVVIPDRGEERKGYQLAHILSCSLFEWPNGDYTDYCEFRIDNSVELFKKFVGGIT